MVNIDFLLTISDCFVFITHYSDLTLDSHLLLRIKGWPVLWVWCVNERVRAVVKTHTRRSSLSRSSQFLGHWSAVLQREPFVSELVSIPQVSAFFHVADGKRLSKHFLLTAVAWGAQVTRPTIQRTRCCPVAVTLRSHLCSDVNILYRTY